MIKKILLSIFLVFACTPAWCANKYLITGGGNWSGASWNTASNQATSNTTAPTTSDVAILDQYSGNVVIDATTCVAGTLTATNYTGTISGSSPNQLWVYGSWTLSAGMSMTGSWIFKAGNSSTTGTWTPAGQTFPGDFIANGTGAKTMSGSGFTVTGVMSWLQTCNLTGTGFNIDVLGGWTGTSYFNDTATNPTVTIRGGTLTGTLPNTPQGCILEPSVSDITFAEGIPYKTQLREKAYLIVNTSTYSVIHGANTQTYFIAYSGTLKTANMTWNSIYYASGSPTLEEDFYVYEFGWNNNTTGGFNGVGKVVHILSNWATRTTCIVGGTATYRVESASNLWVPTLNGSTLLGTLTINANVEFASSGDITLYDREVVFGGAGSLKYVSGNMIYDATWLPKISGVFYWDWNATLNSMSFQTNTDILNLLSDLTIGTDNFYAGSTLYLQGGKTLSIQTAVNAGGNENYNNIIKGATFLKPFVGNKIARAFSGLSSISGSEIQLSNGQAYFDTWWDSATTFTIRFNVRSLTTSPSYVLTDENSQFGYIKLSSSGYIDILMQFGNNYHQYCGAADIFTSSTPAVVVITKAPADTTCKIYVNGTLMTGGSYTGTQANKVIQSIRKMGHATSGMILDELVIFSDEKDSTWVTADYNSGSPLTYNATSAGVLYGWHLDDSVSTTGIFDYSGTYANQFFAKTDFTNIDASGSATRIDTWHGTVTNSINVFDPDGKDIGGAGVSVTHY